MKCLICEEQSDKPIVDPRLNNMICNCINCGQFLITAQAKNELDAIPTGDQVKRSVLSHAIRKMQANEIPSLTLNLLKKILEKRPPTAPEQCDNFILWLGNNLDFAGATIPIRILPKKQPKNLKLQLEPHCQMKREWPMTEPFFILSAVGAAYL